MNKILFNKIANVSGLDWQWTTSEDPDLEARIAYLELMIKFMIDPNYSVSNWKASDGVWVTMDATLLSKLINALSVKETLAFNWLKAKQEAINSAFNSNDIHTLELISTVYE